jgi:zinc protease
MRKPIKLMAANAAPVCDNIDASPVRRHPSPGHWASRALLLVLAFGLLAVGANAQRTAGQNGPGRAASSATSRSADIQQAIATQAQLVTEFDVNGLKVLVKRRSGSLTVAAGLFVRGGVRNINSGNAGIEAMTLEAATEASTSFPRARMRSDLARLGAATGAAANFDYSVLTLATPRANFPRAWEIFTDIALHPTFAPEDVQRVREQAVTSLRDQEDDPDSFLQKLQAKAAYSGHPYMLDPDGTTETVMRMTSDDLRAYHKHIMQTSRLLLVIVGDIDAAKLRVDLLATFGKLPRGEFDAAPVAALKFTAPSVEVTQRPLPTNYVQGYFSAPALNSPDIYPMQVAITILGRRIYNEVRVKRNLSYAPDAFLGKQGANIGALYVTAVDANQSVALMLDEIARLQRVPIEHSDVDDVVGTYLTNYYMTQETNAAQAGELARYELLGGGWRNSLNTIDRLRQVTPADVQRVAQIYIRNIRFVVIGNPDSIDKSVFTRAFE